MPDITTPDALGRARRRVGRRVAQPVVWFGRRIGRAACSVGRLVGRRSKRTRTHTALASLSVGMLDLPSETQAHTAGPDWVPWWSQLNQQQQQQGVPDNPLQQLLAWFSPPQPSSVEQEAPGDTRYGAMLLPRSAFPLQLRSMAAATTTTTTSSSTVLDTPQQQQAQAASSTAACEGLAPQQLLTVGTRMWGNWWDGRGLLRVRIYDFALYVDVDQVRQQLPQADPTTSSLTRKQRRWLRKQVEPSNPLASPPLQLAGLGTASQEQEEADSSSFSSSSSRQPQFTLWPLLLGAPTKEQQSPPQQQQEQQQGSGQAPPAPPCRRATKVVARYEKKVGALQRRLHKLHTSRSRRLPSLQQQQQEEEGVTGGVAGRAGRRYQRIQQQLAALHARHAAWQQQQQQQVAGLQPLASQALAAPPPEIAAGTVSLQQQQASAGSVLSLAAPTPAPSSLAALQGAGGVGATLVLRAAREVPLHLLAGEYEKVLARRLARVGGDPGDPALAALLDTFRHPERLPASVRAGAGSVRPGAAIVFERGPGDVLLARVGGEVLGRVEGAGKLCEALLDLYLGEQPVSGRAKGAAALSLQRMSGGLPSSRGPPYYDPAAGGGGRIHCPGAPTSRNAGSSSSSSKPLDLDACELQLP